VERVNRTLQDRLVKELRLDDVCDMQAGNLFLPEFLNRSNKKFSVRAAKPEDLHRRLTLSPERLSDVLCHREQRHVGQQLTLTYDRKQLILERSAVSEELGGQYVDLYDFADGRLEVRWKGQVLPTMSSTRISESATPPSSRTRGLVMHSRSSRPSRISSMSRR